MLWNVTKNLKGTQAKIDFQMSLIIFEDVFVLGSNPIFLATSLTNWLAATTN